MTKMNTNQKIAAGAVFALLLMLSGCVTNTPPQNPPGNNPPVGTSDLLWMAYAPVQAETNPWQVADIQFVNAPTELERVQAWLSSAGISFENTVFVPHDEIVCDALNCPRGDYLLVNPTDKINQQKLRDAGFFAMNEPFIWVSESEDTSAYTIELVNASAETIFFGGCNDYVTYKHVNGEKMEMIWKTCVWEGVPNTLSAGKSVKLDAQPLGNGTYSLTLGYGVGCAEGQALSQAACTSEKSISSNTFDVRTLASAETISMTYSLKQCLSNPWQVDTNELILTEDKVAFTQWLEGQGITPLHVNYAPAPEGLAVCLACSCPSGETYRIIIPASHQALAETLGFVFEGDYVWPTLQPDFDEMQWRVFTPYQCFANQWNVKKEPVRNIEKDFALMQTWLEEKGVDIKYVGFVRGISLSQQCTKLSTDKYGVAVNDDESAAILAASGFVPAGLQQTKLFTSTEDTEAKNYLFKTKFCESPAWGEPEVSAENGNAVVQRVMEWLAESGIPSYEKPTLHTVGVSVTRSCGTDSGLGVYISVPAWAETHVLPYGFAKPSYAFDPEKSQVYPAPESAEGAAGTVETGSGTCVGEECAAI